MIFGAAIVLAALLMSSCKADGPKQNQEEPAVEIQLSQREVSLEQGATATLSITAGNGTYTASSDNEAVATASVEDNVITITGVTAGDATITVKDAKEKTAEVAVTVTEKVFEAYGIDMGIGYGGGDTGTHALIRVPIRHKAMETMDLTAVGAVTMEAIFKYHDFLNWADNNTSNWLNTIMGNSDYFLIRSNHYEGGKVKINALAPGRELNSPLLSANKWYHVALTFKNGHLKLYVNGYMVEEGDCSTTTIDLTRADNTSKDELHDFYIGSQNQSRFLNGWISEVRIWTVARSEEQIIDNQLGLDLSDEDANYGLFGYWKFAGTEREEILKDYGPNGLDAELIFVRDDTLADVNVKVDNSLRDTE